MKSNLTYLLNRWKAQTGALPWGVQRALINALETVYSDKFEMAYGRNYDAQGRPCFINSVSNMLSVAGEDRAEGDTGLPSSFGVVSLFDAINYAYAERTGYDGPKVVQHETAYLLLSNFGPIKTVEQATQVAIEEDKDPEKYIEKSDADLLHDWIKTAQKEVPGEPGPVPGEVRSESH